MNISNNISTEKIITHLTHKSLSVFWTRGSYFIIWWANFSLSQPGIQELFHVSHDELVPSPDAKGTERNGMQILN
jgi:hypothetical protein